MSEWAMPEDAAREDEWEEDWDDELVDGNFVTQLREELQNSAS